MWILTKEEKSLLLYVEDCCVNKSGYLENEKMSGSEIKTLEKWNEDGFIYFRRLKSHEMIYKKTHVTKLSNKAWDLAYLCRRDRSEKSNMFSKEEL